MLCSALESCSLLWEQTSTANRIFRSYLVSGSRVQVFSHASCLPGEAACKHLQSHFICPHSSLSSHPSLGTRVAGLEVSLAFHPAGRSNLSLWDWQSSSFLPGSLFACWGCLLFHFWSSWHNGVLALRFSILASCKREDASPFVFQQSSWFGATSPVKWNESSHFLC